MGLTKLPRIGMNVLTISSTSPSETSGARLSKLAEWIGVPSHTVVLDEIEIAKLPVEHLTETDSVVAMTADALAYLYENRLALGSNHLGARNVTSQLLVFAFERTEREGAAMSWLTACPMRLSAMER